jgi:hypothetical protein
MIIDKSGKQYGPTPRSIFLFKKLTVAQLSKNLSPSTSRTYITVGFVIKKSSVFWDITPCSPVESQETLRQNTPLPSSRLENEPSKDIRMRQADLSSFRTTSVNLK